jgi:hypothetical protein
MKVVVGTVQRDVIQRVSGCYRIEDTDGTPLFFLVPGDEMVLEDFVGKKIKLVVDEPTEEFQYPGFKRYSLRDTKRSVQ